MSKKYLIVGGVAGGASAAARLRRLDEDAEIIMFERGPNVSFSNCSLPYYLGDVITDKEKLILMTPEKFDKQYNIQARTNSNVTHIDSKNQIITVLDYSTGKTYQEAYDKLILSPGAKPIVPPFEDIDLLPHFVLRNVVDVEKIKNQLGSSKHVTVIGGGFIGIEVAENLKEIGIEVTLVEASNQIMRPFDYEMVKFLEKEILDHGIEMILSKKVIRFDHQKVILEDGTEIKTDVAILAIGMSPDTKFIQSSNIELAKSGHIPVNDNYQTSVNNVYAIGDAILVKNAITSQSMPLPLAGPANKQGRLVADHINGKKINNKGYIASSVIKVFDVIGASTGLNESWIKFHNLDIPCERVYLAPVDRVGIMPESQTIFMKLLFNKKSGKILGAQALGKGLVEKRIDTIAVAIKADMTVEDLQDLEFCYAPPVATGKDPVNHAGYIANNLYQNEFKQVAFTNIDKLLNKNAQIIDVRSEPETKNGMLIGAKNIPMTEMRERLHELDKAKPVYVHCRTGQRSYNVAMLLQQHGFDVYNIAGSFIFMSYYYDTLSRLTQSPVPFNKANFN